MMNILSWWARACSRGFENRFAIREDVLEFSLTDMCKAETTGYNWTRPKHRGLGSNGEKVKRRRMPIMNAQAGVLKKWSEDERLPTKHGGLGGLMTTDRGRKKEQ